MNFFVIANPASPSDELDSPIIDLEDGQGEAVAVFLNQESAYDFLVDHGWEDEETIAELRPTELVKWLSLVHRRGIKHIVVRPTEYAQIDGMLELRNPYQLFAELLELLRAAQVSLA